MLWTDPTTCRHQNYHFDETTHKPLLLIVLDKIEEYFGASLSFSGYASIAYSLQDITLTQMLNERNICTSNFNSVRREKNRNTFVEHVKWD